MLFIRIGIPQDGLKVCIRSNGRRPATRPLPKRSILGDETDEELVDALYYSRKSGAGNSNMPEAQGNPSIASSSRNAICKESMLAC